MKKFIIAIMLIITIGCFCGCALDEKDYRLLVIDCDGQNAKFVYYTDYENDKYTTKEIIVPYSSLNAGVQYMVTYGTIKYFSNIVRVHLVMRNGKIIKIYSEDLKC